MNRILAVSVLIFSGAAFAQEAPPEPQPAASPAPEANASEVKALEPVDQSKDEKAAKSSDDDGGVTYSAIGISRVSTEFDNLEPTIMLNGGFGIRVPTIDWVAAEIDLGISIIPGKNDGRTASSNSGGGGGGGGGLPIIGGGGGGGGSSAPSGNFTRSSEDLNLFSIGVFAVLRTPPDWFHGFYAKGKAGYGYVQSGGNFDGGIAEINDDGSGTAFGAGAGWRYGKFGGVEFLYTRYPAELDSLGFSVSFGFGGGDSD